MIQPKLKFLGMLFALSILTACGANSSGGGGGSTPAPTATLSASPTPIAVGQHSTLTFSSTNADTGTIDNGVGRSGANGSIPVNPAQTTTYTITVTGPGGSAKASATVTVDQDPTVTISANSTSINPGQSTTLTVTASNASQVVITDSVDTNTYTLPAAGGTQNVTPAVTTTYFATATGVNASTAQAAVTVAVLQPAPTVTLNVSPAAIFAGQKITLTWTSTNATSVVIDNNVGAVQPVTGGSVTLHQPPTQTTTYTATATGDGQQATATATVTVSPLNSADGMLPDSTNTVQEDIDANGAVGTKQFMEYVNTEYQAFDKATLAPVPIGGVSGPQAIGTPFSTALNTNGGPASDCAGTGIQLDSVINFDRLASRWVIAAKAVRSRGGQQSYDFCIAVSNTDDVTSTNPPFGWYAYAFQLDQVLGTDLDGTYYFPDWPKLGTWPDAYFATMDMEDTKVGKAEVGILVCAFDRVNMVAGNPMNTPQCFPNTNPSLISNGLYLAHSLIPADFDGTTPPPAGRDEFMVSIENPINDGTTMTSSSFNLWSFHVDWTNPNLSIFSLLLPATSVTTYTPGCYLFVPGEPAITNCATEPAYQSVGQTIDSVGDRFMPRFAYRNFGNFESFLVSHTIQTGPGSGSGLPNPLQTGVRWYELRASVSGSSSTCQSGTVTLGSIPSVCQSNTINPDALLFRFLPSIAQDKDGNAAVGYSFSNSFTNPGIAFSYWDLGSVNATTSEVTIFQGPSEEVTTDPPYPVPGRGQWGSYSSMTVDPADDCTFWYVNEYWPTISNWATRIANFKIPGCQ